MPRYDLCLVGCGRTKRDFTTHARGLYRSTLFQWSYTYAVQVADRTMIVSAKHELLDPETKIAPYDLSIHDLTPEQQRAWAERVGEQVGPGQHRSVCLLMAGLYARLLGDALTRRGWRVFEPMCRLPIGERLGWLNRAHAALSDEATTARAS